jgi:hypothetical protein
MYSAKSFRRSSSSARISRLPLIVAYLIAPRQRRWKVNPGLRPSWFTHGVRDCSKNNRLGVVAALSIMSLRMNCARNRWQKTVNNGSGSCFDVFSCDNLVTILAGNRPILMYIAAMAGGCNSLKMLIVVAKCQLALKAPTGLRTKRSHVRVVPGAL